MTDKDMVTSLEHLAFVADEGASRLLSLLPVVPARLPHARQRAVPPQPGSA